MGWFGPQSGSCSCCVPDCPSSACGDGENAVITQYSWAITLPDTITFWFQNFSNRYIKAVTTGWSGFNGTYVATKNLETCTFTTPSQSSTISWTWVEYFRIGIPSDPEYLCPNTTTTGNTGSGSQAPFMSMSGPAWSVIVGNLAFQNWNNISVAASVFFNAASICYGETIGWTAPIMHPTGSPSYDCSATIPADTGTGIYTPTAFFV